MDHLKFISVLENPWDYISIFIVFIIGYFLLSSSARYFNATKIRTLSLYIWHTFFCCAYIVTTSKIGGDTIWYYTESLQLLTNYSDFSFGTAAIVWLTALFTNGFGLNYISTCMAFNIIGTYGLLAIDASLRHATKDKSGFIKSLVLFVVLIPSMSYWSTAIGKDSVQFMGTGLMLWSCIDFKKRYIVFFISLCIIFTVRPHIGAVAFISFAISLIFMNKISLSKKIFYLLIVSTSIVFILPSVFEYISFKRPTSIATNLDYLIYYIERRQTYNVDSGGGVDISSLNFLLQLFTYLFRPLPFDAHNTLALLTSLDNVFLLTVFTLSIFSIIFLKREKFSLNHPKENRWFLLIFSVTVLSILSLTTSNFGISARQKWMVMPILLYYMFLFMSVSWSDNLKNKKV